MNFYSDIDQSNWESENKYIFGEVQGVLEATKQQNEKMINRLNKKVTAAEKTAKQQSKTDLYMVS